MSLVNKENVLAAQDMYEMRIKFLRNEVSRLVQEGIYLGEAYEKETITALDEIEKELDSMDECFKLLNHLLWS